MSLAQTLIKPEVTLHQINLLVLSLGEQWDVHLKSKKALPTM